MSLRSAWVLIALNVFYFACSLGFPKMDPTDPSTRERGLARMQGRLRTVGTPEQMRAQAARLMEVVRAASAGMDAFEATTRKVLEVQRFLALGNVVMVLVGMLDAHLLAKKKRTIAAAAGAQA